MCELFGVTSPEKVKLNSLLTEFFAHGDKNPDGWGMAILNGSDVRVEKRMERSTRSIYLKNRLQESIVESTFMAHIRAAPRGEMIHENCHPFCFEDKTGRKWTMIHNGTVFEADDLCKYFGEQTGTTDSERILLYFIDHMNQETEKAGRPLDAGERFALINRLIAHIAPENKINLMLYDGETFYVHTNMKGTLYCKEQGEAKIFSTTKLDDGDWKPVKMCTPLGYVNGQLRYIGTDHGHDFEYTEEKLRLLFVDYATL